MASTSGNVQSTHPVVVEALKEPVFRVLVVLFWAIVKDPGYVAINVEIDVNLTWGVENTQRNIRRQRGKNQA